MELFATLEGMLMFTREHWYLYFFGWWAVFLVGALVRPRHAKTWLMIPLVTTALALAVSIATTASAYDATSGDWSAECYLESYPSECTADQQSAQAHARSLVGDTLVETYVNSFVDTVVWVQCLWFWLLLIAIPTGLAYGLFAVIGLLFSLRVVKPPNERNIIRPKDA